MSYVEGVGDEVVGVMVSVVVVTIVTLLWKTTQVRDTPPIHSVIVTSSNPILNHTNHPLEDVLDDFDQQLEPNPSPVTTEDAQESPPDTTEPQEPTSDSEEDDTEPKIKIKLRFLDETTIDVETKLSEQLSKFRRRHLDSHLNLSSEDKIKLIFNGKIIHRDTQKLSEAGIYDNCVVHCLVQRGQAESNTNGQEVPGNDQWQSEFDLQAVCFPLLGTILFCCWWALLFYSQNFTAISALSLVSLTILYCASVANLLLY